MSQEDNSLKPNGERSTSPAGSNSSPGQEPEKAVVNGADENEVDGIQDVSMSKEEYRRILRKLDFAIIPYCSLLYLLSFLDRVNIGQAAVAGLKADLGIAKGNAYAIALSVFFIGYIIVEVPSNLILKAVKPHRWIPMIMVAWSIVMILVSFLLPQTSAGATPGSAPGSPGNGLLTAADGPCSQRCWPSSCPFLPGYR